MHFCQCTSLGLRPQDLPSVVSVSWWVPSNAQVALPWVLCPEPVHAQPSMLSSLYILMTGFHSFPKGRLSPLLVPRGNPDMGPDMHRWLQLHTWLPILFWPIAQVLMAGLLLALLIPCPTDLLSNFSLASLSFWHIHLIQNTLPCHLSPSCSQNFQWLPGTQWFPKGHACVTMPSSCPLAMPGRPKGKDYWFLGSFLGTLRT